MLAVCALAFVPVLSACGDDDDDADAAAIPSPTTAAQATTGGSTASPTLSGPAGKYTVSLDDIGNAWLTDIPATFVLDPVKYGGTPRLFPTEAEGMKLLKEWGYVEGYETGFIPEGRDNAVLNGSYYIRVETHLFQTAEGAKQAYDYFRKLRTDSGASPAPVESLGNEAAGFVTVSGKIGSSSVNAAYHQVVTLRGNAVTITLTKGAQGFMKIDAAWDLARISDDKMLGTRAAVEPTPTSNFKTPTPAPKP